MNLAFEQAEARQRALDRQQQASIVTAETTLTRHAVVSDTRGGMRGDCCTAIVSVLLRADFRHAVVRHGSDEVVLVPEWDEPTGRLWDTWREESKMRLRRLRVGNGETVSIDATGPSATIAEALDTICRLLEGRPIVSNPTLGGGEAVFEDLWKEVRRNWEACPGTRFPEMTLSRDVIVIGRNGWRPRALAVTMFHTASVLRLVGTRGEAILKRPDETHHQSLNMLGLAVDELVLLRGDRVRFEIRGRDAPWVSERVIRILADMPDLRDWKARQQAHADEREARGDWPPLHTCRAFEVTT
jgi:hypothetical protein